MCNNMCNNNSLPAPNSLDTQDKVLAVLIEPDIDGVYK